MALTKINYNDKDNYQSSALANEYKVTASDMNEIKTVVNAICDQVDNESTYSTSEIAIGTWIDGRTLYRQVFTGALQTTDVILGTISNFKEATRIDGMVYVSDYQQYFPISTQGAFTAQVREGGSVRVRTSAGGWIDRPVTLIVEYTKTT